MISSFNLRDIRESVEGDLSGLSLYLQQLIGEPFLFFRETHGGEITLHFGVPQERRSSILKKRVRGSYVLSVRGSLWMMISPDQGRLILSDPPTHLAAADLKRLTSVDIENAYLIQPGTQLLSVMPYSDDLWGGIALALRFSDHTRFIVRPEPSPCDAAINDDEALPEIADWEVLTPFDRYLSVGPGQHWAYLPST